MNELIIVKQLPIIEQQLNSIKAMVKERVDTALSYECTVDTVKEIKKIRAELNKEFNELEEKRKYVKSAIMQPYNDFESLYKECILPYKEAEQTLKERVSAVENALKDEKRAEVKAYYDEYAESLNIDFAPFEQANIPDVTLSASLKSLKEKAKEHLDRISADISVIQNSENKEEVMVEYKKTLHLALSITTVKDRHERIEAEKQKQEAEKQQTEINPPEVPTETALQPPTEETSEQIYSLTFKVSGTKEQLKELKMYMDEKGLNYE